MASLDDVVRAIEQLKLNTPQGAAEALRQQRAANVVGGGGSLQNLDLPTLHAAEKMFRTKQAEAEKGKAAEEKAAQEKADRLEAASALRSNAVQSLLPKFLSGGMAQGKQLGGNIAAALGGSEAGIAAGAARGGQVGVAVAVAKELAELPWKIKAFADSVSAANRQFAEASGSMAAVFAEADFRTARRNLKSGNALSGSAGFAEEGRQDLADALAPIENFGQNIQNVLSGAFSKFTASFLKESGLSEMFERSTKKINEALGVREGGEAPPLDQWFDNIARTAREEAAIRRQRRGHMPPRADRR